MKRVILPFIGMLMAVGPPLSAARVAVAPISHSVVQVYQAYRGGDIDCAKSFAGYAGVGENTVSVAPGVLSIEPGNNWSNFVGAAQASVPYSIKNVVLEKQATAVIQCADILTSHAVRQQGTRSIRLWWPLMYELAGTTWTLTVLYGTTTPYDDDGAGPNPAGYVHTEVWQWQLGVTLDSMKRLLGLFHCLPFGQGQVPLISDDALYSLMRDKMDEVLAAMMAGDSVGAGLSLGEFEMLLMDRCMASTPSKPNPSGPGTGVAQTAENPACCKLLTDAEYLGFDLSIYQPAR